MNKSIACIVLSTFAMTVATREVRAWGEATHAYLADNVGKRTVLRNHNEIYGAMAPDTFNNNFSLLTDRALMSCIRDKTHGYPLTLSAGFMDIWTLGKSGPARYAAYGYLSHNDLWGEDFNAHWTAKTGTSGQGYTISKAEVLVQLIANQTDTSGLSPWDHLGIPPSPVPPPDPLADPTRLIAHYLIEKAGDVVIRRNDPAIGSRMAFAALVRPAEFQALMAKVIGPCYAQDGATTVAHAEEAYRGQVLALGLLLLQSEATILAGMADRVSTVAPSVLQALTGKTLDPAMQPMVRSVVSQGLDRALTLIEGDYMTEIDTIAMQIEGTMAANGVTY